MPGVTWRAGAKRLGAVMPWWEYEPSKQYPWVKPEPEQSALDDFRFPLAFMAFAVAAISIPFMVLGLFIPAIGWIPQVVCLAAALVMWLCLLPDRPKR